MSNYDDLYPETEEFPYPQRISRDAFLKDLKTDGCEDDFNVDKFLFEHYRYTLLEDSQNELEGLLGELDQELFDLVNNDYFDFINLGKTLDGGESLVDRLRVDVTKYKKRLTDESKRLNESKEHVSSSLENINKLGELKTDAQNMLLLNDFINKFEQLLAQNSEYIPLEVLRQLTSLYLTIHQLLQGLPNYQFVVSKANKINILRYEFKGILDEYLRNIRPDDTSYDEVVSVLSIYSIIGHEKDAVQILGEKKESKTTRNVA